MTTRSDPAGGWRTSSYSGSSNNCVQIHLAHHSGIAVRDSKNPHATLTFTPAEWRAFTAKVKTGAFAQPGPR
jgi:hypothetical protein